MRSLIFTPIVAVMLASRAIAQSEPPAGVRATGMGGAFVAVADDASSVFWNPAGLASGSYFSLVLDNNRLQTPDETSFPHRRSAFMLALGAPAVGLSYFSTTTTRAAEPLARTELAPGRNTEGVIRVERLAARHVGATLVQSVTRNLAIGATFRLVRGSASTGLVTTADAAAFDDAADLFPEKGTTKFDGDIGLMLAGSYAKAGITVRNVLEPAFSTPDGAGSIMLERRVRGGVSLLVLQTITLAADVDFTKAPTSLGEWRDAAIGAEAHPARRAWVRGGIHWNTAGGDSRPGAAPIASLGGSYAVYGSILADGQVSLGSENGDRGWGVGLRFVF
jgi:hypothetical protein